MSREKALSRRSFLAAAGSVGSALGAPAAPRRPNVIVILADDLGFADVGFNGCRDYDTPHVDRIASSGVRFTNGYVSHPYCSPSRAGLLTGRYQQRFGHEANPKYDPGDATLGMSAREATLADAMRGARYATGFVGKWHLGAEARYHPLRRGFQEMFGFLGGGHDYYQSRTEGGARESLVPLQRNGEPVAPSRYLTDEFSAEAVQFIRRHRAEPFFLYLAYNAPHSPNQAPQQYLDRTVNIENGPRSVYAAMNVAMDNGIGSILRELETQGLREDTMIVFFSDNGGRTDAADNRPLRGSKGLLYEGGIRVPFAISWPRRLKPGTVFEHPVSSLDIFPTAMAAAGARSPGSLPLDGNDLLPYLTGGKSQPPHDTLYWRTIGGEEYAVRRGRHKLVKTIVSTAPELYDLERDVRERTNLAAESPGTVKELQALYDAWNKQLMQPLWSDPHLANLRSQYKAKADARSRALPPSERPAIPAK